MWRRTAPLSPAILDSSNIALKALLQRPDVARLLATLHRDGEEARIVGGAVRDALMKCPMGDIDIATTVLPAVVTAIAVREGWKAVPTGIGHGTVTIVINSKPYEVTTLRRDVATDGRRAVVAFTRDFREDAFRRDFTINALSLGVDGTVHDYATGLADAQAGLVRFMGDAETRIREDYLRILRFFRFHASHGAGYPDKTGFMACGRLKAGMAQLSRERIRQELLKLLAASGAVGAVRGMEQLGISSMLTPGIAWDIDSLVRLVRIETDLGDAPDAILRLAALASGAADEQEILKLSNHERARILAANACAGEAASEHLSVTVIRSLVFRAGAESLGDALLLGAARAKLSAADLKARRDVAATVFANPPVNPFRSADLAALGIAPGPRMGRILKAATALWLSEGLPAGEEHAASMLKRAVHNTPD
jgi:poly(A) polymerase